jgi:UDP-GlcNAc:undecaprenyl-phosphate GlcNAc-1-phosphate transferase
MTVLVIVFVSACLASLALVPPVKRACDRYGVTDRPDSHRKLHREEMPLGGGIAIFLSTVAVLAVLALLGNWTRAWFAFNATESIGLLLASALLVFVGVVDDAISLRGRQKLAGQILACGVLMLCGLVIERVQVFEWRFQLGLLSYPLTLLWLLAAINAINLLDGIDGLAATVGIIDCVAISLLALLGGHRSESLIGAAFAGSLLGFLYYNFPRAKLFLGDAGSMLIGLVIGTLAIQTSLKGPGTVLLAAPLCLMTIPLFDSVAAMLRRKLTGRSVFSSDRGHLQHRLTERFGSIRAVGIVAIGCGLTGAAALTSIVWRNELVAVGCGAAIVLTFVASRMFGHAELRLLASRLNATGRSLIRINIRRRTPGTNSSVHLQGYREWQQLWADLTESAEALAVHRVELNVNAPMIQEGFHASWTLRASDPERTWRLDMPVVASGRPIGRVRLVGERLADFRAGDLEKILCLFESFESQVQLLFTPAADSPPKAAPPVLPPALLAESAEPAAS